MLTHVAQRRDFESYLFPEATSEGTFFSGRDRRRSGDLTLFRRALYQLSYPTLASANRGGGPDGI